MLTVKTFDDRPNPCARAGSRRSTRTATPVLGAAIRHATAALRQERVRRRLLLILSDGKPNDVDVYEGRYGVEDTRQAVAESRPQDVAVSA